MPSITCAILCRNESAPDRYLRKVLARCREFADRIVVLDDQSTDATPDVCREYGAIVQARDVSGAWGNESVARAELFDLAREHCDRRDWVLFVDADMILHGDPRPLTQSTDCNAWAWPLFDVWGDGVYRSDRFWQGHLFPRVWMIQPHSQQPNWSPAWGRRGLHVGHIPPNFEMVAAVAPDDVYWLHMAYATHEHRISKHAQYLQKADLLTPHEIAHAQSIIDDVSSN